MYIEQLRAVLQDSRHKLVVTYTKELNKWVPRMYHTTNGTRRRVDDSVCKSVGLVDFYLKPSVIYMQQAAARGWMKVVESEN